MTDLITLKIEAHIAEVTLNRAAKRNALNMEMFQGLATAAKNIRARPDVRVVILVGDGQHFCAGIDTSLFAGPDSPMSPESMRPGATSPANFFQAAAYVWRELPVPVVAAIQGSTFGAGLQLAAGADLRYVSRSTRFSIMEIRWGLVADMAITTTLRHQVAPDRLMDLAMTGRIMAAEEAQQIGLATAVVDDPAATARAWARQVAGQSPDAVRAAKRLFRDGPDLPDAEALRLEAQLQIELVGRPNQREAVAAAMEGREPQFSDGADSPA